MTIIITTKKQQQILFHGHDMMAYEGTIVFLHQALARICQKSFIGLSSVTNKNDPEPFAHLAVERVISLVT